MRSRRTSSLPTTLYFQRYRSVQCILYDARTAQTPAHHRRLHPGWKACARLRLGDQLRRQIVDRWAQTRWRIQETGRRSGRELCDGARSLEWRGHLRRRTAAGCRGDLMRCGRCCGGGRTAKYAICCWELVSSWAVDLRALGGESHLTKSKIEMRLPTGDSRQVPSGVKRRLPRL